MNILIIGGGNMGLTYARSFLNSHIVNEDQLHILEKSPAKAEQIKSLNVGTVHGSPGDYIAQSDLIILAVKPQDTSLLFEVIKDYIDHSQVILSIMAGINIDQISNQLGNNKIIRAMPNLPAQIGVGMTVFHSSAEVTRIELVMVQNLLNATGKTLYVEDESLIDAATAISGSGPAYIFYFMDSMINAAVEMGFSQSEAELLSYQTFRGAVESFNKFNLSCQEWIDKVSSKGGTTEAAFKSFGNDDVKQKINSALEAARKRAVELSQIN